MKFTKTKRNILGSAGLLSALVVVAAPAFVAHAVVDTTTITVVVDKAISVSNTDGASTGFNILPTATGVMSTDSDVVTVSTNSTAGYNLSISASDTTAILTGSVSDTIPASANTYTSPTTLAVNTWGYAVAGLGTFDASYTQLTNAVNGGKWAGMPVLASLQNIKSTATTATNDTTTVWYAVHANMGTDAGTFTDGVTYTALVK